MTSGTKKERADIKISLKSFDVKLLNKVTQEIVSTAQRTGAVVRGPVPMPVKTKKFTVIKSPHVYKDSREQFEIRYLKRLLFVVPTPQTVNALMKLNLSAGVNIKIVLN